MILEPQRTQRTQSNSAEESATITSKIIESAIKIHKQYGPGLLETAYEQILAYELVTCQGLRVETQKALPITHENLKIDCTYRLDLLVDDRIIVELKAHERTLPIHEAQLLTYLKLSGLRVGLIINFNMPLLKDGIKRMVL